MAAFGFVATLLAVVGLAWFIYTPLPVDMEQKFKVSLIDAGMRSYGHLARVLSMIGVMQPFSDLDRYMADKFVLLMTTGRPWVQTSDPGLRIQELYTDKNKVRMRMYEPVTSLHQDKRPLLVYFHGGGFSTLSIDSYDAYVRALARGSGVVVVSVNYRLSPQYPFPVPMEDCLEAVNFLTDHASKFNLDIERVAVGGDSAGGNLAASISLTLRERLKAQLLLVPALQYFTFNTTSVIENQQYFPKTSNSLGQLMFWTNYINSDPKYGLDILTSSHTSPELKRSKHAQKVDQNKWLDKKHIHSEIKGDLSQQMDYGRTDMPKDFIDKMINPSVSPLMAEDNALQGLPRSYVMVTGYDIIRDDGIMYAERLRHAGVNVHFVNHRASFHNALLFSNGPFSLSVAKETVNSITDFLQVYL